MGGYGDEDEDVKAAFVAVYGVSAGGRACGGGFLVYDDVVVTCAHVVNTAIGRGQHDVEYPGADFGGGPGVSVAFPYVGDQRLPVRLIGWVSRKSVVEGSPLRAGVQTWGGDLAMLQLLPPSPSGVRPVRLDRHRLGSSVLSWYGSGESTTVVAATVQAETGPWIALDTVASAKDYVPGYSGGPVWDRARKVVVGVVVGAEGRRGYAIPIREIVGYFDGHQTLLCEPGLTAKGHAALEPFREAMTDVLDAADFPAATLQRLAARVRLAGTAERSVDVDDLIGAALRVRRGVATLTAGVCKVSALADERRRLTAASLRVRPGELLSAAEVARLTKMISGTSAATLVSVVRRALPDLHGLPGENEGMMSLLDFLERLAIRPGTVPALLRVVEFLAAGPGQEDIRDGLRAWCNQIADRIGFARETLLERRFEAESWAADRETHSRVQIRLERVDGARFRHTTWIQYGSEYRTVCGSDVPQADAHVLECIERVLREEVPDDVDTVLLEFFVDVGDLDLDVDRWIIPGAVDRMLGVEYEVVLRCLKPRLVNRQQWRRRWHMLGALDAFVLDESLATSDEVYAALAAAESDIACVVAFPTEAGRLPVVAGCVYAGVPAVLWSRSPRSEAERLRITAIASCHGQLVLPAALRKLRLKAAGRPDHPDAHIGLLWDDPYRYPRELTLTVPG